MAVAASLSQAAGLAYDNVFAKWSAGTFVADLTAFNADILALFPGDGSVAERTFSNWLVIGLAIQSSIPGTFLGTLPLDFPNQAAQYLYRAMWAAQDAQTAARITAGQGGAILAAYNARWG